ncbi:signal peptidase I [Crossiella cryophila]|uniref:Signal peptidase I n=1 Tax=Crossiella cryophila TaxID=43355 RepID=A0A7W7G0A7_9PSEU|nr:signal peptidase I [Crossiella cryophila]
MADIVASQPQHNDPDDSTPAHGTPRAGAGASEEKPFHTKKPKKKGSFWKELPILIVVALLLTFLIQEFLARVYVIPSQSMEQTLHGCDGCTNDRVLVDKVTYRFSDPKPGDVVVFRGPDSWSPEIVGSRSSSSFIRWFQGLGSFIGLAPPDERDFVKRVIAVGGQTVQCCDDQNRLLVDGKPLTEPYLYWDPERNGGAQDQTRFGPITVPQGHLWMMGDNRNNSSDSRAEGHGPVPVANVIGKAQVIVLPPGRWQTIDDPNPQAAALGAAPWQAGIPAGIGMVGAVPTLWLIRRGLRPLRSRKKRDLD